MAGHSVDLSFGRPFFAAAAGNRGSLRTRAQLFSKDVQLGAVLPNAIGS